MNFKKLNDVEIEQFWHFANANGRISDDVFKALDCEVGRRKLIFRNAPNPTLVVHGTRMDAVVGIVYESNHVQSMTMTEQLQLIADSTGSPTTRRAIQAVINGNLDESHIAALSGANRP